jgi:serine acetyltransferase
LSNGSSNEVAGTRKPSYELEKPWRGAKNRLLQELAKVAPGAQSTRVKLHRARGVNIGENVWIGYDSVLETGFPSLITLEDNVSIGIRVTIIAHFRGTAGVRIEHDAFIGPGVIILPSVVIGHGAVVSAGSVVTRSVPPLTVVQGNPAVPVAKVTGPFRPDMTVKQFTRQLRRLDNADPSLGLAAQG